jgi:flagellar basal-body rod modification protein FlgD
VHASLLQMLHSATQPANRPSAASLPATTSTSSSTDPGVDLTSTFLQLLSVQLENQSPLDPVDPNQFTTQLATFDSLGELTQIQSLMQTLVNDVSATPSSPSGSSANPSAGANSISYPSFSAVSH